MAATRKSLTSIHGKRLGLAKGGSLIADGNRVVVDNDGGTRFGQQGTPVAVNTTATLTIDNLLAGIITSTTAAAVTGTLPTGTLTDAGVKMEIGESFDWTVINTGAANAFTVAAGTAHTVVGNMVVALSTSAQFRTRKTAAATFVTYRI